MSRPPSSAQVDPTIGSVLDRARHVHADNLATFDLATGEQRTWAETGDRVDRIASALRGLGLESGVRVGVLALNSSRHLELWFAIPAAGLVLNDLNFRLAPDELRFILDDSGVRVLFVDPTFLPTAVDLLDTCDSLEALVCIADDLPTDTPAGTHAYESLASHDRTELPTPHAGDLAAVFYTGGTTGLPKGAMLSHRNLTANALHMVGLGRLTRHDRYLHAGPQFHLADGTMTYSLTWVGGTHIFIPGFDPAKVIGAYANHDVTVGILVPTMINMTVNHPDMAGATFPSLRLVIYGASPMPAALQRQAVEAFGCGFAQAFGMTEAAPLVSWLDEDAHRRGLAGAEPWASRLRSAGATIPGVRTELRAADGQVVTTPGTAGEVYIQGPNIMSGYWNRDDETANALVDGWYRSGDVAYTDANGYLFIVDRAKDMIISGGENIYTSEVENAIYDHPAVLEAAVFAVPDDEWGEIVHAEVVTKPDATLDEKDLVDHCRRSIAGYKVPRSVNIRSSEQPLPKSSAGKILKRELREPHWEGRSTRVS